MVVSQLGSRLMSATEATFVPPFSFAWLNLQRSDGGGRSWNKGYIAG
jgi:hypothetical protein